MSRPAAPPSRGAGATVPVLLGHPDAPVDPLVRLDALGDHTGRLIDRSPTPAGLLDDTTLDAYLVAAIDALPPHLRSAVLLSDVHGLPYDQPTSPADHAQTGPER